LKKSNRKKNRLEFLKNRQVQFGFDFISLKLKKPNQTQTKKTGPNRKKPSQTGKPSQIGLSRVLF